MLIIMVTGEQRPADLARRGAVSVPKMVNSWNEWDPLGRIIVDRVEALSIPGPDPEWWHSPSYGEGLTTLTREPLLLDLHCDTFLLRAPIIECLVKRSRPIGEFGQDAFGGLPTVCQDRGPRHPAWVAIGRQDANPRLLDASRFAGRSLGGNGDHLVADIDEVRPVPRVGDVVEFIPGFALVLNAFTSP